MLVEIVDFSSSIRIDRGSVNVPASDFLSAGQKNERRLDNRRSLRKSSDFLSHQT